MPDLVSRSFTDEGREQLAAVLTGSGPLVLDDIDKTSLGDWVAGQLFAAIDNRLANDRPLLITSNLDVSGLVGLFPERFRRAVGSRIAGSCEVVELKGSDRRLQRSAGAAESGPSNSNPAHSPSPEDSQEAAA